MVVEWRELLDNKSREENRTRVLMLEAYGTLDQTMRYYGTSSAPGGHFPFNFLFITDVHYEPESSAEEISATINKYLDQITDGRTPNWV
ncbi:hypothetical protein Cfor_03156, partial [Coptotermes formosanus]